MRKLPPMKELKQICRPSLPAKSGFYELVNGYISVYFTWIFLKFGLSANFVTGLMMVMALVSGGLFMLNQQWSSIAAGVLLILSFIFDWCDGEVARYNRYEREKNSSDNDTVSEEKLQKIYSNLGSLESTKGGYLDKVYHAIHKGWIYMSFAVAAYLTTDEPLYLIIGLVAVVFYFLRKVASDLVMLSMYKYLWLSNKPFKAHFEKGPTREEYLKSLTPAQKAYNFIIGKPQVLQIYILGFVMIFRLEIYALVFMAIVYPILFVKKIYVAYTKNFEKEAAKFTFLEEENVG